MHLRESLAIGLVLVIAGLAAAKDRTWTSSDGRTMEGEFVRELDGDVTFLVKGKLVTIALDKLAPRDQQIVRDLASGKPVADESAVPAATTDSTPPAAKPAEPDPFAPVPDRPEKPASSPSASKRKAQGQESRVWTDIFGRKATGKFIRIFGSNVVVSRAGGPLTIDYFQLSDADQTYVRELLTSRGEEDLIPVKPPPKREDPGGEAGSGVPDNEGSPEVSSGPGVSPSGPGPYGPGNSGPGGGISGPRGPAGRGGFGPRGPGGPGMSGPRLGPGGSGIGPGSSGVGPGSDIGSGIGPRGPYGPSGFGPPGFGPPGFGPPGGSLPGSSSPDTAVSGSPYSPPQTSSPQQSDYLGSPQRSADELAERARRESEQMDPRLMGSLDPRSIGSLPTSPNTFQRVPVCSNCRKQVTEEESKRSTCPHCGARWIFNQYNPSATSRTTSSSPLASLSGSGSQRAVRTTLIVVGAIVVVVVLCGGAIAVAMALASASRPAQRYRI